MALAGATYFRFLECIPRRPALLAACLCAFALIAPAMVVGAESRLPQVALDGSPPPPDPRLTGTPFLRTWAAEDYDASPVNWRVLVHPNGLVYVGNNSGVLEYDGARWQTRPMAHGGRASALVADGRGRLWAGGHDEICVFEPDERGSLRAIDMAPLIARADRPIGAITRALTMPDGVYLQSQQRLFRFHETGSGIRVQVWRTPHRFSALYHLGGDVHVHTAEQGIARVKGNELVAVAATVAAESGRATLGSMRTFDARSEAGGWLLATAIGPLRWAGAGEEARPLSQASAKLFRGEQAVAGLFLADGRIAFSMTRSGLVIFDQAGRIERRVQRAHGLPNNRIEALEEDPEGGLWLALHYGLARLQLDSPFATHAAAQGIEGGPRRILRHWDRVYVAHSEGLSWRDPGNGRFHAVAGLTIGANRLGQVGERLVVTSGGLKEVLRDAPVRPWSNRALFGVIEWKRQPGWIVAAVSVGLTLFEPKDEGWANLGQLANLPADVETLHDSGDGWLWLATQAGGIQRVDFRQGLALDAAVETFGPERGVTPPRRSENVQIFPLNDTVAISSSEWLLRHDAAARRFVPVTRIRGFGATRGATLAHPTADGGLWLRGSAPRHEFVRLAPTGAGARATQRFTAGAVQHLIANSIYEDAPTRTLWIAGQGSLVSMALDWKPLRPAPPLRVQVRGVETGSGEMVFGGAVDLPPSPRLATLDSTRTALRFAFAAPTFPADFRGAARTQYRTRLDGFEAAWSEWTVESHRDFTGLPYRALTFRVQARDLEGRVSEDATFAFAIAPPWWLTGWAYGGYAALLGLAVTGIVKVRTRRLRLANERLTGIVAERTATLDRQNHELDCQNRELTRLHQLELDEKIAAQLATQLAQLAEEKTRLEMLRYQLNPHFLFNSLASVSGLVATQPALARTMAAKLAEFCRLTLHRDGNESVPLAEEFRMLELYLEIEKTRWGEGLQTSFQLAGGAQEHRLPAFLLLSLVENAVKFGGVTNPEHLQIRVSAHVADDTLIIEVANTGIWAPRPVGRAAPPSTGIGLENLRQRLARRYPGRHELTTQASDGWVTVGLRLSLKPDNGAGRTGETNFDAPPRAH